MRPILLVDDEPSLLMALAYVFRLNGYAPTTASNGAEGLAAAHRVDFAAALVDINMPGMDGFAFCREFKQRLTAENRPVPPFWIMTGAHTASAVANSAAIGAQTLLRKPFELGPLLREIEASLDRPAVGGASPEPTA